MMGAPLQPRHPDLVSIRKCCVRDFDNHLVFFELRLAGVSVVRVLHAASNGWAVLAPAERPPPMTSLG